MVVYHYLPPKDAPCPQGGSGETAPGLGVHTGRIFRVRPNRVRVCRVSVFKILYRTRPTHVRICYFSDARVSGFVGRVWVGFGFIFTIFGFCLIFCRETIFLLIFFKIPFFKNFFKKCHCLWFLSTSYNKNKKFNSYIYIRTTRNLTDQYSNQTQKKNTNKKN